MGRPWRSMGPRGAPWGAALGDLGARLELFNFFWNFCWSPNWPKIVPPGPGGPWGPFSAYFGAMGGPGGNFFFGPWASIFPILGLALLGVPPAHFLVAKFCLRPAGPSPSFQSPETRYSRRVSQGAPWEGLPNP